MNIFQRDYSSFTNESFRDDISIQKWNYSYNNVQDLLNDFYVKLDGCVNQHAPLKKLSPKEIKVKFKPCVSGKILKMIKIRDKAYARKKDNPIMRIVNDYITYSEIELTGRLKNLKSNIMLNILLKMLIT